ncbi:alpha/beta hydrolase [Niastella vici]|uniref:Alpha/beta hydrolase n=1 Tax=Niastella vici TaxID=1703345 RepID=A0A1V9FQS5_9BACT|nr:alpha/beta fold hydrolase [Niastella vici]OQP60637.1 alpha/beta hydrolase [Niastella vici]
MPSIQTCNCNFKIDSSYIASAPPRLKPDSTFPYKIDSSFQTVCGYLIVPENRKKASSKMIKLPFIVLKSKSQDKKKDPFLFTTGGPGGTSLAWINGMQRSSVIESRDCIAFEQRGTQFAIPNLRSFELDTATREAYRKNLNKDSMWLEGVKRYKKKLEKKGIDLSGYNTDETVADIIDLLKVLKIDSVNLTGVSYSGVVMLAVLQKEPSKVRSLVLDSPLPTFISIDEDEPMNFVNSIHVLSGHCEKDSLDQQRYGGLATKFENYFNSIADKKFYFPYVEKGTVDTIQIEYTKNELFDILDNTLQDPSAIKNVPFMITEMIKGNHAPYIQKKLDDIFNKNIAPSGMRMSVYCADQASYHSEEVIQQLYQLYPFLRGFHINDVYNAVCDCWKVPPISVQTRQPYYSSKPVLIGDGEMDPACSPLYMYRIKHYMPNAQCFLFINRSHGIGGTTFRQMTQMFLDHPYNRIVIPNEQIIAY